MEVNANQPRDRVNSQRRDLPISVMARIHLDAGRARVAKGAQAAQAHHHVTPEKPHGAGHGPFRAKKRVPDETNPGFCLARAADRWGGAARAKDWSKFHSKALKPTQTG